MESVYFVVKTAIGTEIKRKRRMAKKKLGRTSLLTERPKGRKTPILLETDYRAT